MAIEKTKQHTLSAAALGVVAMLLQPPGWKGRSADSETAASGKQRLEGQSHVGIAQGIGQALWEACVYDPRSGQLLSGSFLDYAMPRADLLPAFDTEISEVPSTTNPLGMRGGSEGGITPGLAAVANAVVDALAEFGVRHIELPATPERIWQAIRARRNGAERRDGGLREFSS